jgi:site-specific DNA recombinase
MDAIGIIRVSRVGRRDGESFASPDIQRERIEDACERESLNLLRIEEELDTSGGKTLDKRPGLKNAVESIETGEAKIIVGAYFDRLYRSLAVQADVGKRVAAVGGRILTLEGYVGEETSSEWLDATLRGMMAEYYRRQVKERSGAAQRRAIERGVPIIVCVPPGYYKGEDGRLIPDPIQAPIVAEAFAMRADGVSIEKVRQFLKGHGIVRTPGGIWKLLQSPIVLGRIEFGGMINDKAHEPIVDEDTFRRVQSRKGKPRTKGLKSNRLLARVGVLRCSSCGSSMSVGSSSTYRCSDADCATKQTITADTVEKIVEEHVRAEIKDFQGQASNDPHLADADAELDAAQKALDAAIRAFDGIDEASAREKIKELSEARNAAQTKRDLIANRQTATAVIDLSTDWDSLLLDGKRALIKAVVERVEVLPVAKDVRGAKRLRVKLFSEEPVRFAV